MNSVFRRCARTLATNSRGGNVVVRRLPVVWLSIRSSKPTNNYNISDTVKVIDGILYRVVPNGLELITCTGSRKTVTVADGTVRISAQAFVGSDVIHVVLPYTLRSIGHKAFFDCKSLAIIDVAVEDGVTAQYKTLDGVLYNADMTVLN